MERERQALHDGLTGLPNRTLFHERAERASRAADATAAGGAALDLDHFKEINDTLGHHVGDLLLCRSPTALRGGVRARDIVARLGGDEFAVLVHRPRRPGGGRGARRRGSLDGLDEPFEVDGVRARHRRQRRHRAVARRTATTRRRCCSAPTSPCTRAKVAARRWSGSTSAADDGHPGASWRCSASCARASSAASWSCTTSRRCDARTGDASSASRRWCAGSTPMRGCCRPTEFIPIAENTGLIEPLTRVVLDQALEQPWPWRAAGHDLAVAVNLSARQLTDLDLPAQVGAGAAPSTALPAERARARGDRDARSCRDPDRADRRAAALRELGVALAVDDFGTGYSSLAYLRRPRRRRAQDRPVVRHGTWPPTRATRLIVRSTIDLGHNLGLRVVAEGVEDAADARAAARLGCDVVAGLPPGRPLPRRGLLAWAAGRPRPVGHAIAAPGAPTVLIVRRRRAWRCCSSPCSAGGWAGWARCACARTWLLLLALGLQVLVISVVPEADPRLLAAVHVGTYVLAGAFVWLQPGGCPAWSLLGAALRPTASRSR